jgi:hypothetical protein
MENVYPSCLNPTRKNKQDQRSIGGGNRTPGNMSHRPSLECDRSKPKEAVWNVGFRLRNGSDDTRGKRVGGRLAKTLVLHGDSL